MNALFAERDFHRQVQPMMNVFDHVHGGYGTCRTADTLLANAALPGRGYYLSTGLLD